MTQETGRAPRVLGAGDPVRQQQLLQRQLQQQRLEQQLQHQQLQQHLQRQQLLQHQLQQQLQQQQWSPQLNPTICPSYSYPLSSAVSPPVLPSTCGYPQPTIATTPAATSAEPGVSAAATGPPPLSLRDILHILGESVAVLECLRVLLLQLLQWGGEVGALLQASFLQQLFRFFLTAGASAFCRVKRGFSLFSFSPSSAARHQQPQQQHQHGEQGSQLQQREPLLQQAWQLPVSPFVEILPAAAVGGEAALQGCRKGEQNGREGSFSLFSKIAASAGTIVATSATAARRGGGFSKLLTGKFGALLHGALFLGILYRIYLQWRNYRRLLKRYRRLTVRMCARRAKRIEEAEEAAGLIAAEVESGRRQHGVEEKTAACRFEEDRTATEIFTTAATTAAATARGSYIPLHRDASMQAMHPDTISASILQQQRSPPECVVGMAAATAAKNHPESLPEKAAVWPQTTPATATVAPWMTLGVDATTPRSLPTTLLTASLPIDKEDSQPEGCTHPASATGLLAAAGSTAGLGSATPVPAASQQILLHASSHLPATAKPAAILVATPRPTTAPPPQMAAVRPSPTPAGAGSVSPSSAAEAGGVATACAYVPPSAGSGPEAAVTTAAGAAATDTSKEAASCRASRSAELLRHFLRARMQQLKDPSKAALCAVSLDNLHAVVSPAASAPTEGAASAERGDGRSAEKQPVSPTKELVDGGECAVRTVAISTKADSAPRQTAVTRDGVSSAGEITKTQVHLRQRAASWSDRTATNDSADLIEALGKAATSSAAAPRAPDCQGSPPVSQPWTQIPPSTAGSSSAGVSETAVKLPPPSAAFHLQRTNPAAAAAEASSAAASESASSCSRAVTVPSAVLVSSAVGAASRTTGIATNPVCEHSSVTATVDLAATNLASTEVNDFVEEQLRCFKAAEKRTTPAFRGNPFLRLCHQQQQREQQEKHRQQLLEQEFSRTDIPPWERGSTLESEGGDQSVYTSYWKAPFFPHVREPQAATTWPQLSPSLLSTTRGAVLPQKARPTEVSQQTPQQRQHAEQQQTGLQQMPQQPHKQDGVVQRQEDWLPTQLHPLDHSVGPLNDSSRMSAIRGQPTSVRLEALLDGQPREPHRRVEQTAQDAQGRVPQLYTCPAGATTHPSPDAGVTASGEVSASCYNISVSPPLRRLSGTRAKSGRNTLAAVGDRQYFRASAAGERAAATDAGATAGPTAPRAAAAADKAAAAGAPQNVKSARIYLAASDTSLAATDARGSVGSRRGGSIIRPGATKSSTATRGQSRRRHSTADGAAGVDGGTTVATGPPTGAAAGHVTAGMTPAAGRPRLDREDYFRGTACTVRKQQEAKLRHLLRTNTLHQKQQTQPQEQTQQHTQHQLQQQVGKDCSTHGTPSTASDADWLAELAAADAPDGAQGRYYYPELYV